MKLAMKPTEFREITRNNGHFAVHCFHYAAKLQLVMDGY